MVLGGYAFAGIRGISTVELNIDSSGWQPVQLKEAGSDLTDLTWRPWRYVWQPAAGGHVVTVRATDGSGLLQSAESLSPHPSGASGWHTLRLQVDA